MSKQNKKKKVVAFTIADEANMPYAEKLERSFKHFHPKVELIVVGGKTLQDTLAVDPQFFYRATPGIARDLIKDYEAVVKIDADTIITGDLTHTWNDDFDLAVVQNSNPIEMEKYPVSVLNIHPLSYVNAGYVVMKSEKVVDHWWRLCASPHFDFYQFREQDLLNIMIFYGMYQTRFLDMSDKWHGLISKGYWQNIELKDDKLILPHTEEWPQYEDKQICAIHWAGGNTPNKMNINTSFKPEVAKWINNLLKKKTS